MCPVNIAPRLTFLISTRPSKHSLNHATRIRKQIFAAMNTELRNNTPWKHLKYPVLYVLHRGCPKYSEYVPHFKTETFFDYELKVKLKINTIPRNLDTLEPTYFAPVM
jgi:hypothetical protein